MSAEATRDRLLAATIAAIDAGGEAAVSVDAIAKVAGVTAPTIYNHFRNREALIAAAQTERFDRRLEEDFGVITAAAESISTREEFNRITDLVFEFILDPERTAWRRNRISAVGASAGRPELAASITEKFVEIADRFAEVMEPLQAKGFVRSDLDLRAFAAWFIGSVTGRIFIELSENDIDTAAWDRVFREAVLAVALAPDTP